jgi:hypothetical protein
LASSLIVLLVHWDHSRILLEDVPSVQLELTRTISKRLPALPAQLELTRILLDQLNAQLALFSQPQSQLALHPVTLLAAMISSMILLNQTLSS